MMIIIIAKRSTKIIKMFRLNRLRVILIILLINKTQTYKIKKEKLIKFILNNFRAKKC